MDMVMRHASHGFRAAVCDLYSRKCYPQFNIRFACRWRLCGERARASSGAMVAGGALSSQAAPVATAGDVVEQDPSGDEQYFDHSGTTTFVWIVAGIGMAAEAFLLVCFMALIRGRRDKQVKAVGFSFIACVLLGAMCGQAFLILQVRHIKLVEVHMWLDCALQTWLLLLHLHLLNAPILAKFCAVLKRIRGADTQRLLLWDQTARRQTAWQLLVVVVLFCAHLGVSAHQNDSLFDDAIAGGGCVDDGDLAFADRSFYVAHMILMLAMVLPSPIIYVIVTGSSFAPLFPEWHALCQAVQALLFAAALTGTTFFVDQVLVIMVARLLAVELLCAVVVGGFVWAPLQKRLLPPRRRRREAAEVLVQAKLERKAKLQEHLSRQMQERQLEHAHRLAALQLRLSLLRTPRQASSSTTLTPPLLPPLSPQPPPLSSQPSSSHPNPHLTPGNLPGRHRARACRECRWLQDLLGRAAARQEDLLLPRDAHAYHRHTAVASAVSCHRRRRGDGGGEP